jgi:hypothetical protein
MVAREGDEPSLRGAYETPSDPHRPPAIFILESYTINQRSQAKSSCKSNIIYIQTFPASFEQPRLAHYECF